MHVFFLFNADYANFFTNCEFLNHRSVKEAPLGLALETLLCSPKSPVFFSFSRCSHPPEKLFQMQTGKNCILSRDVQHSEIKFHQSSPPALWWRKIAISFHISVLSQQPNFLQKIPKLLGEIEFWRSCSFLYQRGWSCIIEVVV